MELYYRKLELFLIDLQEPITLNLGAVINSLIHIYIRNQTGLNIFRLKQVTEVGNKCISFSEKIDN